MQWPRNHRTKYHGEWLNSKFRCHFLSCVCQFFCLQEVKVSSPDYENVNMETVLNDFLLRIDHYREKYETLDEIKEKGLSFMKIYNTGEKVIVHKHEGHIQSRIVYYLMNIHIVPRTIYLTRVRVFCRSLCVIISFLCIIFKFIS